MRINRDKFKNALNKSNYTTFTVTVTDTEFPVTIVKSDKSPDISSFDVFKSNYSVFIVLGADAKAASDLVNNKIKDNTKLFALAPDGIIPFKASVIKKGKNQLDKYNNSLSVNNLSSVEIEVALQNQAYDLLEAALESDSKILYDALKICQAPEFSLSNESNAQLLLSLQLGMTNPIYHPALLYLLGSRFENTPEHSNTMAKYFELGNIKENVDWYAKFVYGLKSLHGIDNIQPDRQSAIAFFENVLKKYNFLNIHSVSKLILAKIYLDAAEDNQNIAKAVRYLHDAYFGSSKDPVDKFIQEESIEQIKAICDNKDQYQSNDVALAFYVYGMHMLSQEQYAKASERLNFAFENDIKQAGIALGKSYQADGDQDKAYAAYAQTILKCESNKSDIELAKTSLDQMAAMKPENNVQSYLPSQQHYFEILLPTLDKEAIFALFDNPVPNDSIINKQICDHLIAQQFDDSRYYLWVAMRLADKEHYNISSDVLLHVLNTFSQLSDTENVATVFAGIKASYSRVRNALRITTLSLENTLKLNIESKKAEYIKDAIQNNVIQLSEKAGLKLGEKVASIFNKHVFEVAMDQNNLSLLLDCVETYLDNSEQNAIYHSQAILYLEKWYELSSNGEQKNTVSADDYCNVIVLLQKISTKGNESDYLNRADTLLQKTLPSLNEQILDSLYESEKLLDLYQTLLAFKPSSENTKNSITQFFDSAIDVLKNNIRNDLNIKNNNEKLEKLSKQITQYFSNDDEGTAFQTEKAAIGNLLNAFYIIYDRRTYKKSSLIEGIIESSSSNLDNETWKVLSLIDNLKDVYSSKFLYSFNSKNKINSMTEQLLDYLKKKNPVALLTLANPEIDLRSKYEGERKIPAYDELLYDCFKSVLNDPFKYDYDQFSKIAESLSNNNEIKLTDSDKAALVAYQWVLALDFGLKVKDLDNSKEIMEALDMVLKDQECNLSPALKIDVQAKVYEINNGNMPVNSERKYPALAMMTDNDLGFNNNFGELGEGIYTSQATVPQNNQEFYASNKQPSSIPSYNPEVAGAESSAPVEEYTEDTSQKDLQITDLQEMNEQKDLKINELQEKNERLMQLLQQKEETENKLNRENESKSVQLEFFKRNTQKDFEKKIVKAQAQVRKYLAMKHYEPQIKARAEQVEKLGQEKIQSLSEAKNWKELSRLSSALAEGRYHDAKCIIEGREQQTKVISLENEEKITYTY